MSCWIYRLRHWKKYLIVIQYPLIITQQVGRVGHPWGELGTFLTKKFFKGLTAIFAHVKPKASFTSPYSLHFTHCNQSSLVPLLHSAKQTQQTFWLLFWNQVVSSSEVFDVLDESESSGFDSLRLALDVDGIVFFNGRTRFKKSYFQWFQVNLSFWGELSFRPGKKTETKSYWKFMCCL